MLHRPSSGAQAEFLRREGREGREGKGREGKGREGKGGRNIILYNHNHIDI